ncbi:MAG: DUF1553 domain-containing protein [Pedosphaera sp.]|nr:DUF1553 domain-containing protein [Pedosphaera sp.]
MFSRTVIALILTLPAFARAADIEATAFFETRVRPVLVERCYSCHSHGSEKLKSSLYLDSRAGMLRGGESGQPALVPGEPAKSRLIEAIRQTNPDLKMPPKNRLADSVIADFESWVRSGAPFPESKTDQDPSGAAASATNHWSFCPVANPPVPKVKRASWSQSDIDRFILLKLEDHGLNPSPRADRRTLLRRATYDLTGLPPSAEEVEAFVRDNSPNAFANVVDRLLASPRYGERWGRHWLDVARYADTKGYVYYYEESRFVHPHRYRDWVIQAFNEDLPYDRFLLLQIAADQLVPAQREASNLVTASTISWPTPVFEPSVAALGFITLGRRFLDSGPDIIDDQIDVVMRGTQALTVGCARCHDHKFDPIPTRDYYSLYGVFQGSAERIVSLERPPAPDELIPFARARSYLDFERGLREKTQKLEAQFTNACQEVANRLRRRVKDYLLAVLDVAKLPSDANVRPTPEDVNPYNVRQWEHYLSARRRTNDPIFGPWHSFAALSAEKFPQSASRLSGEFAANSNQLWNPRVARLFTNAPATMTEVAARYGDLFTSIYHTWQSALTNAAAAKTPGRLPDPAEEAVRQVLYGPDAPVLVPRGSVIELDVHLYFDDPNRVALANQQMGIEQWLITSPGAPPHSVILEDRAEQTDPVVFRRGDPLKPGATVPRQFLELIAGTARKPFGKGSGRLELAQAIASPDNPLTARVMVNRVWAHHFGQGLVGTPGDFGTRSDAPSHPELLDWLARRFMDEGWSIKKLHRLIMLSSAYQQSSDGAANETAPRASELDPENRWLWHFNRQRLEFEALRDSLLAVSGGLDLTVGGPAVDLSQKPFSRRRTVYGKIDRKFLPSMFRTFDFANPDMHAPQRFATSVPQQALFLINHPFIHERANALAAGSHSPDTAKTDAQIQHLYRRALQRAPTTTELREAHQFIETAQADVTARGEPVSSQDANAVKRDSITEWEQLAQVLLLSNEFLFID